MIRRDSGGVHSWSPPRPRSDASEQPGGAACQRSERVEGAGSRAAERHVPAGPRNNRPNAQNSRAYTAGLLLAYLSTGSPASAAFSSLGLGLNGVISFYSLIHQ